MAPMQKKTLRQQMKRTRQRMTPNQRRRYSEAISAAVVQSTDWANATVIGLYASFRNEVDTWALMEQVRLSGKQLALPKVVSPQTPLSFYHVTRNDGTWTLEAGAFGVMEPNASCPEIPRDALDLLFVPALAISTQGHRLGWGGGYYDRTLATIPTCRAYACAFDCQIVAHVPTEPHDIPLTGWFTESGQYSP